MRKIFIIIAFIMLVCTGCGIGPAQNSAGITVSMGTGVTPEPTESAASTPEQMESASVMPEITESASVTPEITKSATVKPKPEEANYKINSDSIILSSGLKISDMEGYFNFKRAELIQKLGSKYEYKDSGAEGSYRGHHYWELGITLVFDDNYDSYDEAPLKWIDCDEDKLELNGLTPDMSLNQIQERIGKGKITKEKIEEVIWQHEYWYVLSYKIGDIILEFTSYSEDGSDGYDYMTRIEYNND